MWYMYLHWNGWSNIDLFQHLSFAEFRRYLDLEMKKLKASGESYRKKKAEIITKEEESPQALLDTIVYIYCNGLYFALCCGEEHRLLKANPFQIKVTCIEKAGQTSFLQYTEHISKNRPGGLKVRKVSLEVVVHHTNQKNPSRCFVRLFKL